MTETKAYSSTCVVLENAKVKNAVLAKKATSNRIPPNWHQTTRKRVAEIEKLCAQEMKRRELMTKQIKSGITAYDLKKHYYEATHRADAATTRAEKAEADLAKAQAVIEKLEVRVDEPCDDCATIERDELRAVIERVEQYTLLLEAKRDRYLDAKLSDSENTHDWVISTDECANRLRALLTPAPASGKNDEW